jgi:WD40 repeat protein
MASDAKCRKIDDEAKSKKLNDETNGTRVGRLLVNTGTKALRQIFDKYHPPSQLQTVLNTKQADLQTLRRRIINDDQWNLLYPASGNPDSKEFDITLLSVLLRNICNLNPPATGWSTMPLETDRSEEANLLRIKLYRNKILAHAPSTEISDSQFADLWANISQTLQDLKIPQAEIDELKTCPLSSEEESYIKRLGDWKSKDDASDEIKVLLTKTLEEMKESIPELISNQSKEIAEEVLSKVLPCLADVDKNLLTQKLCKFTFDIDIKKLVESFHPGTRKWLFTKVGNWFREQESQVFVLTAGPGVGKSVLAAKIIDVYRAKKSLAACHFCKFNNSNYSNPLFVIQSLASQMCDSIEGFKKILLQQLKRPNKVQNLEDAFQVYLKEPLQQLPGNKPMLVVIDGLDECESDQRTKLLDVLAKEFSKLPPWLKVLVTSRPEINVKKKLCSLEYINIAPNDKNNTEDIKEYLTSHLPILSKWKENISCLTETCEGSFLFAFHLQKHLQNCEAEITKEYIENVLPEGINSVYHEYFARLEEELKSVCPQYDINRFLKIIVGAYSPIPLSFVTEGLELSPNLREMKASIAKINQSISTLLYVSDDTFTVYHRSVNDWLTEEEHIYTVNYHEANELLWKITEGLFKKIKKTTLIAKNCSEIKSFSKNKTIKHVLKFGFEYCFAVANADCKDEINCEWLVDVVILHMITIALGFEHTNVINVSSRLYSLENELTTKIKQKVEWNCKAMSSHKVAPIYVQDIFNEGPSEIFSKEEKDNAKYILSNHFRFWCEKTTHLTLELNTPTIYVTACAFSPDGLRLVSCAADGRIHIWHKNSLQDVQKLSAICKQVICCLWSDEILIFHHVESDLMLTKCPVNQDLNIEAKKIKLATNTDTSLAFSPKAFIYRCANDSTIKVRRFAESNKISIPGLKTMETFAVSRDGSIIMAANKDRVEIWKISGNTPTNYYSAISGTKLEEVIQDYCGGTINSLRCSLSSDQEDGIVSCLCSGEQCSPHIFLINTESGYTRHNNQSYPSNELLAAETIYERFLCLQSGKRITVYFRGYRGPLTHFNHNGYPDYYKVGSICRSGNIIALPQESGGICLVELHLPKPYRENFESRLGDCCWEQLGPD